MRLSHVLTACLPLFCFAVCIATPALAQSERLVASHRAWQVKCGSPPGSKNEKCWIEQKVTAEDRPQVGLTVVYSEAADYKQLQIVAPLGVLLAAGIGLKIKGETVSFWKDGQDVGRVPFQKCPVIGCVAEAQVDDKLLNQFKTADEALFYIFDTPEAGIGIPMRLTGFNEALAELHKAQTKIR